MADNPFLKDMMAVNEALNQVGGMNVPQAPTGLVRPDLGQENILDVFFNPTPAQEAAMFQLGTSLLASDDTEAFSARLGQALQGANLTLREFRERERALQIDAKEDLRKGLEDRFKRGATLSRLTKPDSPLVVNQFPNKPPSGFFFKDPNNPAAGVEPIPGGPADTLNAEQAAKAQLLETSLITQDAIDSLLFDPDGTVNRTNVLTAATKLPFTEGRTLNVLIRDSLEAKIRAESGAAVPETEIKRLAERFMPKIVDSDDTIKTKRSLLKAFLEGAFNKLDPTGRFSTRGTFKEAEKALNQLDVQDSMSKMSDDDLKKALGL